jgi:hypothetical protein
MLVCVDTNVMLNAFARNSASAPLFDAMFSGKLRGKEVPEKGACPLII